MEKQVRPVALIVNTTGPDPVVEYVHVNVCAAAGAMVTGPAGAGPLSSPTSPAPGPTAIDGMIPRTSCPPVFVTVSHVVTHCPADTTERDELEAATSAPCVNTVTAELVAGPLLATTPLFSSVPVTVVVNVTKPATDPVYVNVNVMDAPPARVTGRAGSGPDDFTATPAPICWNAAAFIPKAAAVPVFVTVSVTKKLSAMHLVLDSAATQASSFAPKTIVADAVTPAKRAVPSQVAPVALIVNAASPVPEAE